MFQFITNLDHTLILTQMPSLKLLTVDRCVRKGLSLPLELMDDIRLSSLIYKGIYGVEIITPLLTQAIGLEYLSLDCWYLDYTSTDKTQRDLIFAIMHKATHRELNLFFKIVALDSNLEAMLWDSFRSRCRIK